MENLLFVLLTIAGVFSDVRAEPIVNASFETEMRAPVATSTPKATKPTATPKPPCENKITFTVKSKTQWYVFNCGKFSSKLGYTLEYFEDDSWTIERDFIRVASGCVPGGLCDK